MDKQLTAEYVEGYMAGSVATREEITKMIQLELDKRPPAPLPIKHWTKFIVAMINRNDKTEAQVTEETTKDYLDELQSEGEIPALIFELIERALTHECEDDCSHDNDDEEEN